MTKDYLKVNDFIESNWDNTKRISNYDDETLIKLPKPYVVMSLKDNFQEMYYWDTYFTIQGLIASKKLNFVKDIICNFAFLIETYGYIPNGNRTYFLNRSQPPYFSMMIKDYYEVTKDIKFLEEILPSLEKEYDFWMTKRNTKIGLNQYHVTDTNSTYEEVFDVTQKRIKSKKFENVKEIKEKLNYGASLMGEWESGWDFSPRFNNESRHYVMVDLNSNLYIYETNFVLFHQLLGNVQKANDYNNLANLRKMRMDQYLFNKELNIYNDYNFETKELSVINHAASFSPFYAKIANEQVAKKGLNYLTNQLLTENGLLSTRYSGEEKYQWSYPNGWAPLHFIGYKALINYNEVVLAKEVATKYLNLISKNFIKTNSLWEKYNVVTGNTDTINEYGLPEMMGWTAGVFKYFYNEIYIKKGGILL